MCHDLFFFFFFYYKFLCHNTVITKAVALCALSQRLLVLFPLLCCHLVFFLVSMSCGGWRDSQVEATHVAYQQPLCEWVTLEFGRAYSGVRSLVSNPSVVVRLRRLLPVLITAQRKTIGWYIRCSRLNLKSDWKWFAHFGLLFIKL